MKQVATKMQPIVIADIFVVRILLPAFNESSLNINSSSNDSGAGPVDPRALAIVNRLCSMY